MKNYKLKTGDKIKKRFISALIKPINPRGKVVNRLLENIIYGNFGIEIFNKCLSRPRGEGI